jgi:hypothetical protein
MLCFVFFAIVVFAPLAAKEAGLSMFICLSTLLVATSFCINFLIQIISAVSATLVGLALLYTRQLFGMFQFCVRQTAEVENQV